MDSLNNNICEMTAAGIKNNVELEQTNQQPLEIQHPAHQPNVTYSQIYKEWMEKEKEKAQEKKALEDMITAAREQASPFFRRYAERVTKMRTPTSKKTPCSRTTPYSTARKTNQDGNGRAPKAAINRNLQKDFQSLSISNSKI